MERPVRTLAAVGVLVAAVWAGARADPVRNGNELALLYVSGKAPEQQALRKERTGMIHTFRHLLIVAIQRDQPDPGAITLLTREPSSDMRIRLVARQKLSLALAAGLETNMAVAVTGRLRSLGTPEPDLMVVDPAVLKHADRPTPKAGAELLNEVDRTAH
jgi:hypothetical protein